MKETYYAVAHFAQSWGLIYFTFVFLGIVAYVMWPSRKRKIEESADIPLRED